MTYAVCGKACNANPPNRFVSYVYTLNELVKDNSISKMTESCLFRYSMYFSKNNSFSVIVYYTGLVFVTGYIYNKDKFVFIGQKPVHSRQWVRKK